MALSVLYPEVSRLDATSCRHLKSAETALSLSGSKNFVAHSGRRQHTLSMARSVVNVVLGDRFLNDTNGPSLSIPITTYRWAVVSAVRHNYLALIAKFIPLLDQDVQI